MPPLRHITLPAGFAAAGVHCGIKTSTQEDLAIVAAERDVAAAILTTRNQVVGAPVLWCRKVLPRGYGRVRGIVINSGNSNVCTGARGRRDAEEMARLTASLLGTRHEKVLVASTGIIGHPLPMAKVRRGIRAAASRLGAANDAAMLRAIMTTDTRPKSAVVQGRLSGKRITLAGVVKGAGMIAPSLATMIAVLTTDAAVAPATLHKALKAAGERFNAITVDSDTSTSDTVVLLASGAAGNRPVASGTAACRKFAAMLDEVCGELARAVVADGEGATKLIEITVRGARSDADARAAAKTVANSPLVKTAVHGGDPNWGRILAALGRSTAKVDADKAAIRIGGAVVFTRGAGTQRNLRKVQAHLRGNEVTIDCDLGLGRGRYTAMTCDLSRQYVAINADYHT
ncbi:MAG TPA: bifunctional glutamate N-acetyltransferase/amino-acid acetyltransferase ArgJ [Phycisphaerae bacterium]|nr:bifunctional glutamate N-acetyltransferase/amino-acid acetyltransferase ArgJ [Phycisphaerae bacterium]HUT61615.1 bifunctional glutamate N-acetyltransferase/amino-acid acetyltransferase ArgJ [Phycisphaerae bacterium]